jgi:hypothetical protein
MEEGGEQSFARRPLARGSAHGPSAAARRELSSGATAMMAGFEHALRALADAVGSGPVATIIQDVLTIAIYFAGHDGRDQRLI